MNVQLSKSGIRMHGLRYHCVKNVPMLLNDLVPLEPRRQRRAAATATVKVKYDVNNIAIIYVYNRKTSEYVTLKCDNENYTDGMSLWLHNSIVESAKAEAAAFNTEDERLIARNKRILAVKNISPSARNDEKATLARLYEIPRIRQITGNIVLESYEDQYPVSLDDFISHDLAANTALDNEILAPRTPIAPTRKRPAKPRTRHGISVSTSTNHSMSSARVSTRRIQKSAA